MRAKKILLGLTVAGLLTATADGAWATPLQPRPEIPHLSGVGVDFSASPPRGTVGSVIDFSATGGLVGSMPLSTLGTDGLRRAAPAPDLFQAAPPSDLLRTPSAAALSPAVRIFREITSETAGPGPGLVARPATVNRGNPPGGPRGQPNNTGGEQTATLKSLVRVLINRPENLSLDAPVVTASRVSPSGASGPSFPPGGSILRAILSLAVDKEIVKTISNVLRPSIDVNGVVALNVFGLRDIALLILPDSNSIRVIDLSSGRSVSFKYDSPARMAVNQIRRSPDQPGVAQATIERENLLPLVIAAIRRWISTYVFNIFTLIGLVLVSVFWIVWRLARRE